MVERTILIVEDNNLLRTSLADSLEKAGFTVYSAGNAIDAAKMYGKYDPDGILMDIDLGLGANGFDLAESILKEETGVGIVFLTDLPDPRFADRTSEGLPSGIAYIRKSAIHDVQQLKETLDSTIRGEDDLKRDDLADERPFADLTRNQIQIMRMIALGYTNQQIAEKKGKTLRAVEDSIARLFQSLRFEDSAEGNQRAKTVQNFMRNAGHPIEVNNYEK